MLLDLPVLHDVAWMCPYESSGCTCWAASPFPKVQIPAEGWSQSCRKSAAWWLWTQSCVALTAGPGQRRWANPLVWWAKPPCFAGSARKFDHQHRGVCEVIQESYFRSECRDNAPLQSGCFAGLCVQDERGKSVVRSQLLCRTWALRKKFFV